MTGSGGGEKSGAHVQKFSCLNIISTSREKRKKLRVET